MTDWTNWATEFDCNRKKLKGVYVEIDNSVLYSMRGPKRYQRRTNMPRVWHPSKKAAAIDLESAFSFRPMWN